MADDDSVVMRPTPVRALAQAAGTAASLALAALVIATATILSMSAATDIAAARLYSSRNFSSLSELRWASGTRLVVAGVALLLACLAAVRYSRELPGTRYTFGDDDEVTETVVGSEPRRWVTLLVGSSVIVAVFAILLNAVALAIALHLHESPNFGNRLG